ncbi:MAG: SIMPL domain-containing protein [Halobacteriales archaeon]
MTRTKAALVGALVVAVALVGAGVVVADLGADDDPATVSASDPADGPTRTIQVAATGSTETQPDKALVRVSVEASADDPSTARNRLAANVSQMKDALADAGIDDSRIRTTDFDLRERRERQPRESEGEPDTEYRASHRFAIEVDDVDRVGEVVDVAIDNGATNVDDVRFTLSDERREELRTEALETAMSDARQQAETIASSADLEIGGVHSASTTDVHVPTRRVTMEAAADGGGTSFNSGPVSVTATVSVTYNATDA